MDAGPLIPAPGRQKQGDLCEYKVMVENESYSFKTLTKDTHTKIQAMTLDL